MIVPTAPIAPVVSKKLETIRSTETIGGVHIIVSIASKTRGRWVANDVSGSHSGINRRANLVPCCLLFLSILRRREARRVSRRHSITLRTLCRGLSLVLNSAHTWCEHFLYLFFLELSGVQAEFIPENWNKSDDFWNSRRSS